MEDTDLLRFMNSPKQWYVSRKEDLGMVETRTLSLNQLSLYRVDAIPFENTTSHLLAQENLLDTMQFPGILFLYLIHGTAEKTNYYYGILPDLNVALKPQVWATLLEEANETFVASFAGNYPQSTIVKLEQKECQQLCEKMNEFERAAILEGAPGLYNEKSTELGANQCKKAMTGEEYLMIRVAKPLSLDTVVYCENNVEKLSNRILPLTNRTVTSQISNSKNNTCVVSAGTVSSNTRIFTNSETRKEERFVENEVPTEGQGNQLPGEPRRDGNRPQLPNSQQVSAQSLPPWAYPNIPSQAGVIPRGGVVTRGPSQGGAGGPSTNFINGPGNNFANNSINNSDNNQGSSNNNLILPIQSDNQQIPPFRRNPLARFPIGYLPRYFEYFDEDFIVNDRERQKTLSQSRNHLNSISGNTSNSCLNGNSRATTVTRNHGDLNAKTWQDYLVTVLYRRLDYGKIRGTYLFTTYLCTNRKSTLMKLESALKPMYHAYLQNKIPIQRIELSGSDERIAMIKNFQIPRYIKKGKEGEKEFTADERMARCGFSQLTASNFIYGGNWVSSHELSSMMALPQDIS